MSKPILIVKNGTRVIIIYSGEFDDLPEQLHDRAISDPALENLIMAVATAISRTNKSKAIGEEMIDMILYPEKH